ncbi:uncharacterized protein MYCFIDRAFT_70647 [Pseudocercospora fijiensis CIRAD86]|uniref:AB hydrolase-1 domain-containing protein n=1 Tax=Pseudocercospora fijiensis (strain CIRAD86) TaxID=383855 RepID=N1QBV6_PSEFD|nr:uncharacterized protein MYCFIDRAFT_70647 [Pseudocercospora fijiensis CIRAD86]EME89681.1 hypothetical protein MYCFIDRAFT_70647 [Pseudocercospora fijiensis CIRAD86]
MSPNTTIILVHGAWCKPSIFSPLLPYLSSYNTIAPALPSVGCAPDSESMRSWQPDIRAASDAILKALQRSPNEKVVVGSHSYGSIVCSEALQDVPTTDRSRVRHVILQGVLVDVGQAVVLDPTQPPPATWRVENGLCWAGMPKEALLHGLSEEEQEKWLEELDYIPEVVAYQPLTYAAQYDFKTTYVIAEDDQVLPAEIQDFLVATVNEKGAGIQVERLKCGHMTFLRMPEKVAEIIKKVADDAQWQV